jgi:hypothetical protein
MGRSECRGLEAYLHRWFHFFAVVWLLHFCKACIPQLVGLLQETYENKVSSRQGCDASVNSPWIYLLGRISGSLGGKLRFVISVLFGDLVARLILYVDSLIQLGCGATFFCNCTKHRLLPAGCGRNIALLWQV